MIYTCRYIDEDYVTLQSADIIDLVDVETGGSVGHATQVSMYWDNQHLHINFDGVDDEIHATFASHDDPIFLEDAVEVFLCPDSNLTHYFEIDVSPKNLVFDAVIHFNKLDRTIFVDKSWDCEDLKTEINNHVGGWTVRMAIPFASLGRETPTPGEEWKINLYRIDRSDKGDEFEAWSPTFVSPPNFHLPGRFGSLIFERD